jgi:16S rRNA (guanine527-N7)-methyltransferase
MRSISGSESRHDPAAEQALLEGARALGVELQPSQARSMLRLIAELAIWNRAYSLTAVSMPEAMLTHHLLDSIAASHDLAGLRIADIGTGAGFPGLPLAILHPGRQFTLVDSVAKKIRFVTHCARLLGLANVTAVHARAETLAAMGPFDTVIARAFAALPVLVGIVAPLCGPQTRVVALKGRLPRAEIDTLPADWILEESRAVRIPGLDAERHILRLVRCPRLGAADVPGASAH